ncbi:hypothetical protein T11_7176, partial [Trichinella zimbabwensis]
LWLDLCEMPLQWQRTLNAVLGYALALRCGRRGCDLTLPVLINVAWRRYL